MSLINEALKRARVEAARRDAAEKGVPPSALPIYQPQRQRPWLAPVAGFAAGLAVVGIAAGAFWLVRQPAPADGPNGQTPQATTDRPAAVDPQVASPSERALHPAAPQSAAPQPSAPHSAAPQPSAPQPGPAVAASAVPAADRTPPPSPPTASPPQALAPQPSPRRVAPAPTTPATAPPGPATVETRADASPVHTARQAPRNVAPPPASSAAPRAAEPSIGAPPPVGSRSADKAEYLRQAVIAGTTLKVDFIVWSETRPFAQINDQFLNIGESLDGFTLLSVERERVELEGGGRRFWIRAR